MKPIPCLALAIAGGLLFGTFLPSSSGQAPAPTPPPPANLTEYEILQIESLIRLAERPPADTVQENTPNETLVRIESVLGRLVGKSTVIHIVRHPYEGGRTHLIERFDGVQIDIYADFIQIWSRKQGLRLFDRKTGKFISAVPPTANPEDPDESILDQSGRSLIPDKTGDPTAPALAAATRAKPGISITVGGTGETIGHVADIRLKNLTDKPLKVGIPPLILISVSGQSQHYAAPFAQNVTIAPKQEKTVPIEGVCISRSKPPVEKGITNELIAQDPAGIPLNSVPGKPGAKPPLFAPSQIETVLTATKAIYAAAEKLQKDGAYSKVPYANPAKQKEIAVQWGVWSDPTVTEVAGEKPATKADLSATVYKQTAKGSEPSAAIKQKLDQGIQEIFTAIEVTGKAAKASANPFATIDPVKKPETK